jgi:hypothetical protein
MPRHQLGPGAWPGRAGRGSSAAAAQSLGSGCGPCAARWRTSVSAALAGTTGLLALGGALAAVSARRAIDTRLPAALP